MPTLKLEPVVPPKTPAEAEARVATVNLVKTLVQEFAAYAYNTRSYMPHGKDYTDSLNAWLNLTEFAESRPDWTLDVVTRALKNMVEQGS